MDYKNPTNPGSIKSNSTLIKEARELLNKKTKPESKDVPDIECGIIKPCVFGKHNPNYNKTSLRQSPEKIK